MPEHPPSTKLPVIVLPHCTLLPHGLLPLYIFEERYRQMLRHALETDRIFCVAMEQEDGSLAPVGTAGLIRACVRNPDGTSHLLLQGLRRVRFDHWLDSFPFPYAEVNWLTTQIRDPESCRQTVEDIVQTICQAAKAKGQICQQLLDHLESQDDPEAISDIVAYSLLRCPTVLQSLVECPVLDDRLPILTDALIKLDA